MSSREVIIPVAPAINASQRVIYVNSDPGDGNYFKVVIYSPRFNVVIFVRKINTRSENLRVRARFRNLNFVSLDRYLLRFSLTVPTTFGFLINPAMGSELEGSDYSGSIAWKISEDAFVYGPDVWMLTSIPGILLKNCYKARPATESLRESYADVLESYIRLRQEYFTGCALLPKSIESTEDVAEVSVANWFLIDGGENYDYPFRENLVVSDLSNFVIREQMCSFLRFAVEIAVAPTNTKLKIYVFGLHLCACDSEIVDETIPLICNCGAVSYRFLSQLSDIDSDVGERAAFDLEMELADEQDRVILTTNAKLSNGRLSDTNISSHVQGDHKNEGQLITKSLVTEFLSDRDESGLQVGGKGNWVNTI
jgi:hypothetical protein